jgi:HSP20 family protein
MRREMDDLLGDFWDQAGYTTQRQVTAFVPRVDVYYCGSERPEKAVIKIELPGVDVDAVNLEIRGRALVITGERPVRETEGRTYQQVELPSGPFKRVVELQTDVQADQAVATYEDGILRVELPVRLQQGSRQVPIERAEG